MQGGDTPAGRTRTLALDRSASAATIVATLEGFVEQGARAVVIEAGPEAAVAAWPGERVRWLWRDYPLPAVFAFEGRLAGALAALALGCDLRVCGADAAIELAGGFDGLTEERTRTLLGPGVGANTAGRFAAAEALERGLVSRVAAAEGAGAAAREAAAAIAARGPIAARLAKEAVWRGLAMPLEQALRFETDLTLLLQATKDREEGVRAFLEKRPPEFTGE